MCLCGLLSCLLPSYSLVNKRDFRKRDEERDCSFFTVSPTSLVRLIAQPRCEWAKQTGSVLVHSWYTRGRIRGTLRGFFFMCLFVVSSTCTPLRRRAIYSARRRRGVQHVGKGCRRHNCSGTSVVRQQNWEAWWARAWGARLEIEDTVHGGAQITSSKFGVVVNGWTRAL